MATPRDIAMAKECQDIFYESIVWLSKNEITQADLEHNIYTVYKQLPSQFFLDSDLKAILNDTSNYGLGARAAFAAARLNAITRLNQEK